MTYDQSAYGTYPNRTNHQLQLYVRRRNPDEGGGTSGNSSTYMWALIARRLSGSRSYWYDALPWNVNIGGHVYSGSTGLPFNTDTVTLASGGTPWIAHNSAGYMDMYISANHGGGTTFGTAYTTNTLFSTDRIPVPPNAPHSNSNTLAGPTGFRQTFSGAGVDLGGGSFYAWQAQIATNSGFTTGVQLVNSSGTTDWTGLSNHTTYWSRARAVTSAGEGSWSNVATITTTGHPTVPQTVTPTPSTSVTGRVTLTWAAPATPGTGGITGYTIFRDGVQIATTTGTGTSHIDNGRTPFVTYQYQVAARNAYSDSVSSYGPLSANAAVVAQGPPTAPQSLSGVSDGGVPGKVNLTWSAPATTGTGGITGYKIRYADGTLITSQNGTGTSYSVTGLTPGVAYTFVVTARNALSDAEGTESVYSNQVVVTPIGEPQAPTAVTVTTPGLTSNRLRIGWTAPAGTLSGYNIFRRISGADTLIATINATHTQYFVDDVPPGESRTYVVRARTVYTDTLSPGYPGNWGGPASAEATGTATTNSLQAVNNIAAVTSVTNATFSGTYVISQVTANTISYGKVAGNIASAASGGSIYNSTNAVFNGTFTIATPTTTTMTYAKTNANIATLATSGGTITDLTNQLFNGTFTVTSVNVGANTLSYSNTAADLSATAVPVNAAPGLFGKVTNLSNAIFNGTGKVITAITANSISYAQTNANVATSNAAGIVTNTTNRDVFNGVYAVATIPAYNIVTYARTAANIALRTWFEPNGLVFRTTSPGTMDVRFRSGWSG